MAEFARYYTELFKAIGQDFLNYWRGVGEFWIEFFYGFIRYFNILRVYSKNFDILAWVLTIISTIFIITVLVILIIKLVFLLKKYLKFYKTELDKDNLVIQVQQLNNELYQAVQEKNKILNLKVGQLGVLPGKANINIDENETAEVVTADSRFAKLIAVDQKYANQDMSISMGDGDKLTLPELVDRFRSFACSQLKLYYSPKTICLFFSAMATTKIIILEGISGTGKTSLPYAMGKFFQHSSSIISVQPSWRDRAELLGYLNEFTKKFNETDFLRDVYDATYRQDPSFIILDEMNLARIEYYFAEFLSIMEMPDPKEWLIDLVPTNLPSDPAHVDTGKLLVPQNIWFIGTANKDDSTFTITDKVYDRAIPIEFAARSEPFEADYTEFVTMSYEYLQQMFNVAVTNTPITDKTLEKFAKLDQFIITKFRLAIGNRLMRQIHIFVPVYVACGGNELDALDYFFAHKILRKMEALNLSYLKSELSNFVIELDKLFGKNNFMESKAYIALLQRMM